MLTQDVLKELLEYDPLTGVFTRKVVTSNSVRIGDVAGNAHIGGYWEISILNKKYLAHRLAFLYMTGAFPDKFVDHINMVRSDNRWCNLRKASNGENMCNSFSTKKTASSVRNVYPNGKDFMVKIQKDNKEMYLGSYQDLEFAEFVATEARNKYHKEFARHVAPH